MIELVWLVVLLLVPLVYLVVAVFEVQRAAFGSTAAARAAGRAFVLAPDPVAAEQRARAAAAVAMADQGLTPGDVALGCRPAGACLVPGSVVEVRVAYQVPLPFVPAALGRQAPSIRVDATHVVPYGSFREDRS